MTKKMLIDATHAEETRVVVVDGTKVEEFDFETAAKRQLAGNIYLAKVTRVEPSLQAAFVDYGGNRHGFLAFAEIHPDYYQIPVADRKALIEEERAFARAQEEEENRPNRRKPRPQRSHSRAASADGDQVLKGDISGMDVVDLDDDADDAADQAAVDAAVDGAVDGVMAQPAAPRDVHADDDDGEDQNGQDHDHDQETEFRAVDTASDTDSDIESIAEEDVAEEISHTRKPRPRRYKIQEVVKVRQIMLVQVVKEERGNKGAALTTYLSLAGRYCVLMPNTARGGGISRKITQATDRKKLKEIAGEIEVPEGAGLIIRTAGAKRTKAEIKRDYEYLMRLWEQIRELTLKSIAPAAIYEEGNLIKRTIRDLYSREIEEVLVEGEAGYRTAKDFMRMIMPSHAKAVQRYEDAMPLFARYQVESYLGAMFNPTVQLKSGGYIVIGVTEALVAIDVNSGRATKEGSIEDTALKTNLEASEEIARQLRLRDLAGLIVIDFIDMEERRNNAAVEKRLKDKLKTDRARIQVGRISGFGLMEMSRQRLRPGMLESTTQPCQHCHGTGLIRSDDSMALMILRALEEEGTRKRSKEVVLKAPIGIVNYLFNQKREHIALIEARYAMSVRIEADPLLISPDYSIEKLKTATRVIPDVSRVISGNAALMGDFVEEDDIVEDDVAEDEVAEDEVAAPAAPASAKPRTDAPRSVAAEAAEGGNGEGKKKRRRRRRRRGGQRDADGMAVQGDQVEGDDDGEDGDDMDGAEDTAAPVAEVAAVVTPAPAVEPVAEPVAEATPEPEATAKPKPRSRSRSTKPKAEAEASVAEAPAVVAEEAAPVKKTVSRSSSRSKAKPKAADAVALAEPEVAASPEPEPAPKPAPVAAEPAAKPAPKPAPVAAMAADPGLSAAPPVPQPDPGLAEAADAPASTDGDDPAKPKRKGWWSLGR